MMKSLIELIINLHDALGLPSLAKMPGKTWIHEVDTHWTIGVNGNDVPTELKPADTMGCDVPPFCTVVFFNGWIFAILGPLGDGSMGAGELANENSLRTALESAIKAERNQRVSTERAER